MSNIKNVEIIGYLPFNACSDSENKEAMEARKNLVMELGYLNLPMFGIRIKYEHDAKARIFNDYPSIPSFVYVPSKWGGNTRMCLFVVDGEEAVSYDWHTRFEQFVKGVGGWVNSMYVNDIEAPQMLANWRRPTSCWSMKD